MSEIKVEGDIKAGRDNVINVGDQQTYKDIYQMVPDELREEDRHSRKVSWNYRLDRIRKSKIFFLILFVGLIALILALLFLRELYIEYSGGATPNVKIVANFIWSELGSIQDNNVFLVALLAVVSSVMIFLVLPVLAITNLWFKEDRFLAKQRQWRTEIKDRLLHLGERP